ncbi:division/cell wall cluster transcriptional repressor MraZ [Snodgrassella sp. CFCC 13594]|uniref:division/cell wall cluster transcriptional repressor MraZ n=1 Tax=Snodgrassella sp. CFCC 13594 TaxID=1775559 RepID=UPI000833FA24|nr:division/cell wall cluster transcriptional repressor MraZ [Snodgrassella sp. CFCC 13594]
MFGGAYELTIDSKGRLAIPAKFRELLARHFSPFLVATLEKRTHLLLYPEPQWRNVETQLLQLPVAGNKVLQAYQNLLLHNADTLELDGSGRILLPQNLRRLVEFDKEVYVVGRANRIEVWGRALWEDQNNAALDMDEDMLAIELSKTQLQL